MLTLFLLIACATAACEVSVSAVLWDWCFYCMQGSSRGRVNSSPLISQALALSAVECVQVHPCPLQQQATFPPSKLAQQPWLFFSFFPVQVRQRKTTLQCFSSSLVHVRRFKTQSLAPPSALIIWPHSSLSGPILLRLSSQPIIRRIDWLCRADVQADFGEEKLI